MTVGRCWPGRPRPLPDEIFSSWFVRVAGANGLTAAELYGTLFPRALKRLSSDLYHVAPVDIVGALVAGTGLDEATVRSTTLAAWAGKIFDPEDVTFALHWLPPIGNDLSRQTFGQQFCPLCLAEDDVLIFRRRWRLKFVVACAWGVLGRSLPRLQQAYSPDQAGPHPQAV
ncbi:MAG: TniQ family protein [Rhodospirillaceae bacterium]|nr:TniQ family protein [Rhodospirillales bacterium]